MPNFASVSLSTKCSAGFLAALLYFCLTCRFVAGQHSFVYIQAVVVLFKRRPWRSAKLQESGPCACNCASLMQFISTLFHFPSCFNQHVLCKAQWEWMKVVVFLASFVISHGFLLLCGCTHPFVCPVFFWFLPYVPSFFLSLFWEPLSFVILYICISGRHGLLYIHTLFLQHLLATKMRLAREVLYFSNLYFLIWHVNCIVCARSHYLKVLACTF